MSTMAVPQFEGGINSPASLPERLGVRSRRSDAALERRVAERTDELQAKWEREHRLAETLRQALLLTPPRASFPGLAVKSFSEVAIPEILVGGDFCDAFAPDTDHTALILGDVCGKGLVAAVHVPEIKFMLRAFLSVDPSPVHALSRLNERLCAEPNDDGPANLAALTLVVLNGQTGHGVCSAWRVPSPRCSCGREAPASRSVRQG